MLLGLPSSSEGSAGAPFIAAACSGSCTSVAGVPALVKLAQSRRSDDDVTALVRALARERVSVQNLRAILEGMLDVDLARGGELKVAARADSDARAALSQVRTALGAAIAHQAARGTDTIVVDLLDPAIERQAGEPPSEFDRHGETDCRAAQGAGGPASHGAGAVTADGEERATGGPAARRERIPKDVRAGARRNAGRTKHPAGGADRVAVRAAAVSLWRKRDVLSIGTPFIVSSMRWSWPAL